MSKQESTKKPNKTKPPNESSNSELRNPDFPMYDLRKTFDRGKSEESKTETE